MIRHAALPALISAVTPVIAAAMIPVRLERQKIIPVPMLLRPSVDHVVTGVKAVRPVQVPLIPVLMPRLPNAAAVIDAPTVVPAVPVAEPAARPVMTRFMSVRLNAAQAAMDVRSIITLIPVRTAIRPQAALVITGMIPRQNPVPEAQLPVLATNARLSPLMIRMNAKATIGKRSLLHHGAVLSIITPLIKITTLGAVIINIV